MCTNGRALKLAKHYLFSIFHALESQYRSGPAVPRAPPAGPGREAACARLGLTEPCARAGPTHAGIPWHSGPGHAIALGPALAMVAPAAHVPSLSAGPVQSGIICPLKIPKRCRLGFGNNHSLRKISKHFQYARTSWSLACNIPLRTVTKLLCRNIAPVCGK
jgi:hypothetical protein